MFKFKKKEKEDCGVLKELKDIRQELVNLHYHFELITRMYGMVHNLKMAEGGKVNVSADKEKRNRKRF